MSFITMVSWTIITLLSLPHAEAGFANRFAKGLRHLKRDICVEDGVYTLISTRDGNVEFCSRWNTVANATVTTTVTPLSTTTNIYTTLTVTQNLPASRVYTTSTTTPTVTVDSDGPRKAKRAPAPEPTIKAILPRRAQLAQIEAIANVFQAENSTLSGGDIQTEFYTSISSACSCLSQISQWQPLHTITLTETASTVVRSQAAKTITTYLGGSVTTSTIETVAPAVTIARYRSQVLSASIVASSAGVASQASSISDSVAQPLGYNYTCPGDHQKTNAVAYGLDIFQYRIFCASAIANEVAFLGFASTDSGNCLSQCSKINGDAGAVLCKGASFDGAFCALYSEASTSDVFNSTGIDTAILEQVLGKENSTFTNGTLGTAQAASIVATQTNVQALISPPASLTAITTGTQGCSTWTYFNSTDSLSYWTETCSWSSSWYQAWASAATVIYRTNIVIQQSGGNAGSSGSGSQGGGAGAGSNAGGAGNGTAWSSSNAIGSAGAVASGNAGGADASGGVISAWTSASTSTYTTEIGGSTQTFVSSGLISGGGAGGSGTGGAIPAATVSATVIATSGVVSGATAGGTGAGGPLGGPWTSNSTIVSESTQVIIASGVSSGDWSSQTGAGGPIPGGSSNVTSLAGTSIEVIATLGASSSDRASGTGAGGPILPISTGNITSLVGTSVEIVVSSGATSGETAFGTGAGGPISPLPTANVTSLLGTSVEIIASSGVLSGETGSATGGGGPFSPAPSGPIFNQTTWFGETAAPTATSGESGAASSGAFGSGGSLSPPFTNASIVESATTIVSTVISSGVLGIATGSGGPLPGPNATVSDIIITIVSTGTITLSSENSGGTESDSSGRTRSRSQNDRSGLQSPPGTAPTDSPSTLWNGTIATPTGTGFEGPIGTAPIESGLPATSSPPSYERPPGYGPGPWSNATTISSAPEESPVPSQVPSQIANGTYNSANDTDAWTRSRSQAPRSGSQSPYTTDSEVVETPGPSSGFPVPSGNYSAPPTTEVPASPSSGFPAPNGNITFPTPTATSSIPEIVRSSWLGGLHSAPPEEGESGSSGFPTPTSAWNDTTWTRSRTQGPRDGTAAPMTYANGTFASSTASYCTTLTIATLTVTETLYSDCPGTCITQSAGPFPFGYGYGAGPTAIASAAPVSPSTSPSPSPVRRREPGESATPAQIDASCKSVGNVIYNGEFELVTSDSKPIFWGFASTSTSSNEISFGANSSSMQVTPSGSYFGRIVATSNTVVGQIFQPLTLCPNATYSFSGWARALRPLASCQATFTLDDTVIGTILPTSQWSSGIAQLKNFTVGAVPEVQFEIDVKCSGSVSESLPGSLGLDDLALLRIV